MTQVSRTKDRFSVRQLLQLMAKLSMSERDEFKVKCLSVVKF